MTPTEPLASLAPSPSRWPTRLRRGLLTAVALYAALCLSARLLYPSVLYPAPLRAVAAELPSGCEAMTLPSSSGGAPAVHALRWRAAPGSPTLVWFHGNGESIDDLLPLGARFASEGLGFVAMEYRGYGRSAGTKPTEAGLYADAERLLLTLEGERRSPEASPLVVVGYSLGSALAAELAARGRGDRFVLVAPFTSITDIASRLAPFLPARLLLTERFDTLAKAPSFRAPLLVIHGSDDEVVPFAMGYAVAGAAKGARLVTIPKGRHADVFVVEGGLALREIRAFARDDAAATTPPTPR